MLRPCHFTFATCSEAEHLQETRTFRANQSFNRLLVRLLVVLALHLSIVVPEPSRTGQLPAGEEEDQRLIQH